MNSGEKVTQKREFDSVYQDWKSIEIKYRHYSKTEPLKKLDQYKAFLNLDADAIGELEKKIRQDDGLDFVLADVVIHLSNWDPSEFDLGDLGKRRQQVLDRLEQERKSGTETADKQRLKR